MGKVVVINSVTLDGVMQSPGRPEEDTRDGFTHGGWGQRYVDDQATAASYARVAEGGGLQLLLGRRSYEEMLGYWNAQGGPFKDGLNNAPKYVASRTLRAPLPWPNSTLLVGDVAEAVAQLKRSRVMEFDPDDPLPVGRGRFPVSSDNGRARFAGISSIKHSTLVRGDVSQGVAKRRDASRVPRLCPERVRAFYEQTTTKSRFAGT